MSVGPIWSKVQLMLSVPLLIFCLDELCSAFSGVLKALNIIILLSVSFFRFINICFMNLVAPMLGAYTFTIIYFSTLSFFVVLFCYWFIWFKDNHSCLTLVSVCVEYLLPAFYFQFICIFTGKMNLLLVYSWIIVFFINCTNLNHSYGAFNSFIFKINIDMWGFCHIINCNLVVFQFFVSFFFSDCLCGLVEFCHVATWFPYFLPLCDCFVRPVSFILSCVFTMANIDFSLSYLGLFGTFL